MDYVFEPSRYTTFPWVVTRGISSGIGYIQGVITIGNLPVSSATVSLFEEGSKSFVETVISTNGEYRFNNLNENILYFIMVKTGDKEYKVQSRITPAI